MDIKSEFLKLGKSDFMKGLVVAAIGSALGVIQPAILAGTVISIDVLKGAAQAGILAGIAYITKNLFTNSQGNIGKPEPK